MKTNKAGIDLIKQFEGIKDGDAKTPGYDPYICPTGYVTIGYGRVLKGKDGQMLRGNAGLTTAKGLYKPITLETAEEYLSEDLKTREADVDRLCDGVDLNDNQFAALVSFVYNLGAGAFQKSTLLKLLRAGKFDEAANEFPKWVKGDTNGDGKLETLPGLVRRREAERQLFLRAVPETKSLLTSKTLIGSTTAAVAATAAILPEIITQVQMAHDTMAAAGVTGSTVDWIRYALAALTIVGSLTAAFSRIRAQKKAE